MIGLCWGSALHSATETPETVHYNQRSEPSSVVNQSCPTWYSEIKHNGVTRCVCGDTIGHTVVCNNTTLQTLILADYCMYYDGTINDTVIGGCPFNYRYSDAQTFYVTLPNDTSELNSFMCSGLNRSGLLCSQCQQGLGPAVLSYKRECVKCFDKRYGWLLYITATLIPTTILCFIVMVFQFHVTSAEMNAFVFLCQFMTCISTLASTYICVHYTASLTAIHFVVLSLTAFLGIWNLDFFRFFLPSFCISSDMTTLHTLALEYVVAIYPLLLTIVIYFCIEMYDSGVRVVVCVWRPLHVCFARFRRRWDPKGSVINAFATFLLLSYSKLLTVSYSLLAATKLYNDKGETVGPVVLYFDASIEYFSRQHLPFAVLAICILLILAVFPMILLFLYPMRSFQRCLGYSTRIRWQFLHTFADAFQGCYKNGISGAHDCRYFAGLYLFVRIILLGTFSSPMVFTRTWLLTITFPVVVSLLFAYFRPYTNNIFNIIDSAVFASLALGIYIITYAMSGKPFPIQLFFLVAIIPVLYFILFILYKILSRMALFQTCCSRIRGWLQARKKNQHLHIERGDNNEEDLPDRIVNPHLYQPLLPSTNSGDEYSQSDHQPKAGVNSLVAYGSM